MTRAVALLLTIGTCACTENLGVGITRPMARWDVDMPQDMSIRSLPDGFATPPATLVTMPCGAGWLCGKVLWTRSCVIEREWSLKHEDARIERPDSALNACVLVAGTFGSVAGISLAAVVGRGIARAEAAPADSPMKKIEPSAVAGIVVGTSAGAAGIGVDVAAIVALTRKPRLVTDHVDDVDDVRLERDIGALCGGANIGDLKVRIELPGGNIALPLDNDGRFAIDLDRRVQGREEELPWSAKVAIASGRFDGTIIGSVDLDDVSPARRQPGGTDVSAR